MRGTLSAMTEVVADPKQLIGQLAAALDELPTYFVPPVDHYLAKGLYGRRIYVPAGSCVATYVHKIQHITIALKGRCLVVDQDGVHHEVVAPAVFVTEPGTQRAVLALTDTEWVTVHPTDETDVTKMEEVCCCRSFEEYENYLAALPAPEET